jgi:GMP synthase-like glutamine amidotransferase
MSVHDESQYQWLSEEKAFIHEALSLEDGPKVLGICLGAQLLAEALGADVFPGRYKEVGWLPVEFTPAALAHPLFEGFPERLEVFHWHGETFSLPAEAVHLARSEAFENQAFLYGEKVLALQFHLEVTPETVAALIENCPEDLKPGPYVQRVEEIQGQNEIFDTAHEYLFKLLDAFERL